MLTLDEIIERLVHRYDTEELVDRLGIPSDILLERFDDYVEQHYDTLCEELEDE